MRDPYLLPLYISGTLLVTGFAVTFVVFIIIQKQRQVRSRMEQQRLAFDYSQNLLNTKIEVQETTLQMVSEEIHDNVNQVLSTGLMQLSAAERAIADQTAKAFIDEAKTTVRKAINDLRLLSHNLNTGMVEFREIEEAIQSELDRITAFSGITCELNSDSLHEPNPEQRLLLFRIVQEALQNIIKHANAGHIIININSTSTMFSLALQDDGVGFNVEDVLHKNATLGMRNIEQRITLLNGTLKIDSAINVGTTINIQVPLSPIK